MRAVVQRVRKARVEVAGETVGEIGPGLMVLVGVCQSDADDDARYLAEKIVHLRILDDGQGRMELSALDKGAELLIISQFTLYGDARKGRRPSYTHAARGELAEGLYDDVCRRLGASGLKVAKGRFGAEMMIEMIGDGPVTILLDSEKQF